MKALAIVSLLLALLALASAQQICLREQCAE